MKISNLNIPKSAESKREIPQEIVRKTSEKFPTRDPFIMLCGDKYYFYSCAAGGVCCYVSNDLDNWHKPVMVYTMPQNFHGVKDLFWAPECHYYQGKFYLITSVFSSRTGHRNISIYRAEDPLGPFEDISDGCVGKPDWDTIDGTLYVDKEGKPWLVFVHEWTSLPDKIGRMAVARLTDDLAHFASEPKEIFKATDSPFARNNVTDGPYIYETDNGRLIMIWSNHGEKSYFIAKAYSDNGIDGDWKQENELLYEKGLKPEFEFDGGHGMIFSDKQGKLRLALHTPNSKFSGNYEHLILPELEEKNGTIVIKS